MAGPKSPGAWLGDHPAIDRSTAAAWMAGSGVAPGRMTRWPAMTPGAAEANSARPLMAPRRGALGRPPARDRAKLAFRSLGQHRQGTGIDRAGVAIDADRV